MSADGVQGQAFLTLLQLEKEARHAENLDVLGYTMVNRARVLVPHRQAVLFTVAKTGGFRVQAISDVSVPDQNAPFVRWLKRVGETISGAEIGAGLHTVDLQSLTDRDREEAPTWMPSHMMWCPLKAIDGNLVGALLIARDEPWGEPDSILMDHLADAWGHAWSSLLGPRGRKRLALALPLKIAVVVLLAAQFMPVSQTALSPAQVVAHNPELVAAPMDGVIKTVHVTPNSPVSKGDLLFSFDDTSIAGRLDVAEEELLVARTSLRTARQGAFKDSKRNAEVALLLARVALSQAERNNISNQVARKDVYAGRDGVAVFRNASEIEGRPVSTGERVMLIAQPHGTELRIELPVADAVVLKSGSPVRLFLDRNPLTPVDAVLKYAGYEAEMSSSGVLSYILIAQFKDGTPPRIGLRGTAKVQGDEVPLFFYLFRRPISAARQWFGF